MNSLALFVWYHSIPHVCCYCTAPGGPQRLDIDRKDNALGYFIDNMCLACRRCNEVKGAHLTHDQMKIVAQMFFVPKTPQDALG